MQEIIKIQTIKDATDAHRWSTKIWTDKFGFHQRLRGMNQISL